MAVRRCVAKVVIAVGREDDGSGQGTPDPAIPMTRTVQPPPSLLVPSPPGLHATVSNASSTRVTTDGSARSGHGGAGSKLSGAGSGCRRRRLALVLHSQRRPNLVDHERGRGRALLPPSLQPPGFVNGCSAGGEAEERRGREGAAWLVSPPASPLGRSDRGLGVAAIEKIASRFIVILALK